MAFACPVEYAETRRAQELGIAVHRQGLAPSPCSPVCGLQSANDQTMACVGLDVDFLPAAEVFRASASAQAVSVVCGACHSSSRLSDLVPER